MTSGKRIYPAAATRKVIKIATELYVRGLANTRQYLLLVGRRKLLFLRRKRRTQYKYISQLFYLPSQTDEDNFLAEFARE